MRIGSPIAVHRPIVAVAAIHDAGGVRKRDQPARAVDDQRAAVSAELEVRKKAAELSERDVAARDPEQLAPVAADRVRYGQARPPAR